MDSSDRTGTRNLCQRRTTEHFTTWKKAGTRLTFAGGGGAGTVRMGRRSDAVAVRREGPAAGRRQRFAFGRRHVGPRRPALARIRRRTCATKKNKKKQTNPTSIALNMNKAQLVDRALELKGSQLVGHDPITANPVSESSNRRCSVQLDVTDNEEVINERGASCCCWGRPAPALDGGAFEAAGGGSRPATPLALGCSGRPLGPPEDAPAGTLEVPAELEGPLEGRPEPAAVAAAAALGAGLDSLEPAREFVPVFFFGGSGWIWAGLSFSLTAGRVPGGGTGGSSGGGGGGGDRSALGAGGGIFGISGISGIFGGPARRMAGGRGRGGRRRRRRRRRRRGGVERRKFALLAELALAFGRQVSLVILLLLFGHEARRLGALLLATATWR